MIAPWFWTATGTGPDGGRANVPFRLHAFVQDTNDFNQLRSYHSKEDDMHGLANPMV
jgi:hypothetical protein